MPTNTYTPLANITLGSAAASVTFSSISQAYRDLILVVSGSISGSQANTYLYCNGDTSAFNYAFVRMLGDGTNASSGANISTNGQTIGDMTSAQNQLICHINDYSATDKHKIRLARSDQPGSTVIAYASRWGNTAAITSLTVQQSTSNFNAGTTMSLFGIAS